MAFDDGTPLDAAKLGALETKLNNLQASIPKFGSSQANTENGSLESASIVQKQIIPGVTDSVDLKPGTQVRVTLNYKADSQPKAIIMSPVKWAGTLKGNISYYVEGGSITSNGATAQVYLEKGAPAFGIRFFFMVICG